MLSIRSKNDIALPLNWKVGSSLKTKRAVKFTSCIVSCRKTLNTRRFNLSVGFKCAKKNRNLFRSWTPSKNTPNSCLRDFQLRTCASRSTCTDCAENPLEFFSHLSSSDTRGRPVFCFCSPKHHNSSNRLPSTCAPSSRAASIPQRRP